MQHNEQGDWWTAEIESLKAQLCYRTEERDIAHRALAKRDASFEPGSLPQPPNILPDPPSHEESYQNNLTQALRERDTLRDILKLLVPDLKLMAAAAQAMGNPARAQALNNICKGVEL